ncbi:SDR family NAD(P)-dependent oxidoreductase [Paenibacillus aestuarii]|uniref:SDR family NAD(P)-dependent oxidoreductase n=1 Tax=Paenibacillus aestuarii TaxID=516965 RepID=A0ABW0K6C9_9BACL|nr:SDR family oxidoreductase [Paenibacillus aestuarii]
MNTYDGKVVVITGAGQGIGRTLAITYAQQGAAVMLLDKNETSLQSTWEQLSSADAGHKRYTVDLSQTEDIINAMNDIQKNAGRIDVLINNAGLGVWKSPYEITIEEWDYVLGTNLRGTFLCAREAAKIMRTHGGGAIVNISSTRALMSEPNSEAYAASKGGILSLTHALAVSLGPDHITVNAICPGWIENGDYSKLRAEDHTQHPAQRVGKPEDIARACLYLTDPANDFVTGTQMTVDGGMTRKMMYIE